ncbi:hypothetical protein AB0N65_11805 [Paenarthrobacter sp. NPDC089322]|uniref:hypothetical protein n=1 Tax=Paenarthrobacter sp. NPDC089322 TaxID=3155065 RepID=UPI0034251FE5
MAYATVADVEVRYGQTFEGAQSAQVAVWIEDLEAEILEKIPTLPILIEAGRPTVGTLKRLICRAIIRHLNNPKGLKRRTESVDDYSVSEEPWIEGTPGSVELTDAEWAELLPGSSEEAFTITPYGAP